MHFVKITVLLVFVLPKIIVSWDLSVLKIAPTYYTSSIAIYKNRAFLALPRSSCFNNVSNPTLVEVPWFNEGKYGVIRKKMYPIYKEQRWGTCKDHQDVVSVDLDVKRAKLWVLDKGNKKCLPKIVIYNLHYNTIGLNSKLVNVVGEKLSTLVVDPESDDFGTKAYIGGFENYILVFSSRNLKTWKVIFSNGLNLQSPISTYLTMSMTQPLLYLTGMEDFNLHSINLTMIRQYHDMNLFPRDDKKYLCGYGQDLIILDLAGRSVNAGYRYERQSDGVPRLLFDLTAGFPVKYNFRFLGHRLPSGLAKCVKQELHILDISFEVNITTIGEKLGPSGGMITDWKNGLHYYLTRDYAIVRWNTGTPLVAENHEVLMQTYEVLPFVSHMFHGPKNTIWALVNPAKPETCNQRSKMEHSLHGGLPILKRRTVKIWQGN